MADQTQNQNTARRVTQVTGCRLACAALRERRGDAAQRPAFLHLDAAGAGGRGWARRQARRSQEPDDHAVCLHGRGAWRPGCGGSARSGLRGRRVMNGRATESGGANGRDRRVSHFMKAPLAVALLREQHGEAIARKIALTEQRRAKQARSKRRFAFWGEVAARIENGNCNNASDTRPIAREGPPSRM
jgi:hypothetical protein